MKTKKDVNLVDNTFRKLIIKNINFLVDKNNFFAMNKYSMYYESYKDKIENFNENHDFMMSIIVEKYSESITILESKFNLKDYIDIHEINEKYGNPSYIISCNINDIVNSNYFKSIRGISKFNL